MGFDGVLPTVTTADVLATLNNPNDIGWFAYVYIGPEDSTSEGYDNAVTAQDVLEKLKIYRAEIAEAVSEWLNAQADAGGVILGRKGATRVVISREQANDFMALMGALNLVNEEA